MIKLVGTTVINKNLQVPLDFTKPGYDAISYNNGRTMKQSPAEFAIEYGARLCYDSTSQINTSTTFIGGLIKAGHLDVLEHAAATFRIEVTEKNYKSLFWLKDFAPYLIIDDSSQDGVIFISGNLRVWLQVAEHVVAHELDDEGRKNGIFGFFENSKDVYYLLYALYIIAPSIFSFVPSLFPQDMDLDEMVSSKSLSFYEQGLIIGDVVKMYSEYYGWSGSEKSHETLAKHNHASVLGHQVFTDSSVPESMHHATYLITDVSRAYTHQHVRHRLLSHSQQSQRYVDFGKQASKFVMPLDLTTEAQQLLENHFSQIEKMYQLLRDKNVYGLRKEDARCILPNATATCIVSSGFEQGWRHYFKLRTAKDAQKEIRLMSIAMEKDYNNLQWAI